MTVAVFFGCTFIAFGPAIALFLFTIAREPLRVIFLIAGAFFWLVSLLLSSLVWFISVQETFRFAYYKLLKKANEGLLTLSQEETMPISIRQLAYVSGLGFGFMSGAFSVVNILADSVGPGTIGIHGDSQHYFLSSAFMTMAIILLHMFWGVVFFDACEKQQWWAVATVVISHLVVSCLRTCFYCCLHVLSKCRTEPSDFTRCRINRLGLYHDFDRNKHIFTFLH
ncbi:gamma-secretase subunit Aph-1b-like isoform X3 [Phyllopteryx taeniolatus]|uniref:gamma-secretase subunit Aph-1b-like isoform X3 n=1 Tax=Phyllopteryx taeniolatus TaxID=161469 RepID=UPI002AD37519|nr:gamma-secretase subunit Aph-1b-like isoform X3 [Phyllopteryx taeniolatus]